MAATGPATTAIGSLFIGCTVRPSPSRVSTSDAVGTWGSFTIARPEGVPSVVSASRPGGRSTAAGEATGESTPAPVAITTPAARNVRRTREGMVCFIGPS